MPAQSFLRTMLTYLLFCTIYEKAKHLLGLRKMEVLWNVSFIKTNTFIACLQPQKHIIKITKHIFLYLTIVI